MSVVLRIVAGVALITLDSLFSCQFLRLCVFAVTNYSLRLPISEYSLKQNACLSTGGTGAAPVIPKCTSEHSYCCQRVLLQVLPIKSTSQTAVIAD